VPAAVVAGKGVELVHDNGARCRKGSGCPPASRSSSLPATRAWSFAD
jgi:hypothetical protein